MCSSDLHAAKLLAEGKETIHDLDEEDAPNPQAKRQVQAVKTGARIVEPGLRAALDALEGPIAHLDFETVQLAVPRWPGCRPLDLVAVQYSVHREGFADNTPRAFLAPRGEDPRPALIDGMLEACAGARTVLEHLDLRLAPGEIVSVIGPSGAGKSSLLRQIGRAHV